MNTRSRARLALAASLSTAILAAATPALAGGYGMIDLDTCFPMDQRGSTIALGAGLRLGWQFDVGPAWIGPEILGSFTGYVNPGTGFDEPILPWRGLLHAERLLGGVRFGLGGRVRPSVYGRFGLGWIRGGTPGPSFDGGAAIDFALVRLFVFGAHAGYNVVSVWHGATSVGPGVELAPLEVLRWMSLGLHAGLSF